MRNIKRYKRYVVFFLKWLFIEKPRGLDFSMRNKTWNIRNRGNHGYALSPKSAVDEILNVLKITKDDNFLDIGCGKGGVLYFASNRPFGRIAGIEVEPFLYEIAKRNFKKLGLDKRIELFLCDATKFNHYQDFNIFYLFNPFDLDIYKTVIDNIIVCISSGMMHNNNVWLLCYGASNRDAISESGHFELVKDYMDVQRDSLVNIWKSKQIG